jgi:hypothetical protein
MKLKLAFIVAITLGISHAAAQQCRTVKTPKSGKPHAGVVGPT